MRVGFVGLGMQGAPMAQMIAQGGFELHVWARRAEVQKKFAGLGASVEADVATLARNVDHLCLCVTDGDDVRDVLYRCEVLRHLRPDSVLSLHSTVSPELNIAIAADAARTGVAVLDAPVSGSVAAALSKRLVVFAGGPAEVLERARPVYETYASPIIHFGDVGAGSRAKLLNNLLMIVQLGLANRALELGQSQGLSPALLRQAVLAGTGNSFSMGTLGKCQDPTFAVHVRRILTKDRDLAVAAGRDVAMAPLDALAADTLALLVRLEAGEGRLIQEGEPI